VFLQSYGWFIILGLAVAFYFKEHMVQAFSRWHSRRQQETDYHRYGKVSHFPALVYECLTESIVAAELLFLFTVMFSTLGDFNF